LAPNHRLVHQRWTVLQPICGLSFESVDKLNIVWIGWSAAWKFVFLECQQQQLYNSQNTHQPFVAGKPKKKARTLA